MGIDFCNDTERLNLIHLFGTKRDLDIKPLYTYLCPVIIFICFFSIIFNAILMSISRQSKVVNKSPILLLSLNLAVTDLIASLLNGLSILFNSYLPEVYDIKMGQCSMLMFEVVRCAALVASALHLLALAFIHYRGIVNPLHYRSTIFFSQHLSRTINIISIACWIIPLTIMIAWFSSSPCQGFQSPECDYLFLLGFTFRYMVLTLFALPLLLMSVIYLRIFIIISRHQKGRRLNYERSTVSRGALSAAGPVGTAAAVNLPELMVKTDKVVTKCSSCAAKALQDDDEPTFLILSEEIIGDDDEEEEEEEEEEKEEGRGEKMQLGEEEPFEIKSNPIKVKGIYCAKSIDNCLGDANIDINIGGGTNNNNNSDDDKKGCYRDKSIKKNCIDSNFQTIPTCLSTKSTHATLTNSTNLDKAETKLHTKYCATKDLSRDNELSNLKFGDINNNTASSLTKRPNNCGMCNSPDQKNLQAQKNKEQREKQQQQQQQQQKQNSIVSNDVGGESSLDKQDHSVSKSGSEGLKHVHCPKATSFNTNQTQKEVELCPLVGFNNNTIYNKLPMQHQLGRQQMADTIKHSLIKSSSTKLSSDLCTLCATRSEAGVGSLNPTAKGSASPTGNCICDNKLRHFNSKSPTLLLRSNTIGSEDRSLRITTTATATATTTTMTKTFQSSVGSRSIHDSTKVLWNKSSSGLGPIEVENKVKAGADSAPLIFKPTSGRSESISTTGGGGCVSCGNRGVGKNLITMCSSQRSSISSSAVATTPNTPQLNRTSKLRRSPTSVSTSGSQRGGRGSGGGGYVQQQDSKSTLTTYAANSSFIIHRSSNNGNNNNGNNTYNNNLGQNYVPASPTSTYEPQRRHIHASAVPQTNTKALVTTLLILGTYFISYVPAIIYQVLTCIDNCPYPLYTISFSRRVLLGAMTTLLLIAKSIIDPFIYSYRMSEIQLAINKYLSKRRSKSSLAPSIHQTSQRLNAHNLSLYNSHHYHHHHHQHHHHSQQQRQLQNQQQQTHDSINQQPNNNKFKFASQITQANSSPRILSRNASITTRSIVT